MSNLSSSDILNIGLMHAVTDLRNNINVDMKFYLFFDEGYIVFPELARDKHEMYSLVHIGLKHLNAIAYAQISDCFMRNLEGEVDHEMIMYMLTHASGNTEFENYPYKRGASGEIIPIKKMEGVVTVAGVNLFINSPYTIDEASERHLSGLLDVYKEDNLIKYNEVNLDDISAKSSGSKHESRSRAYN